MTLPAWLLLALASAGPRAAAQAGPVVLLGEQAELASVPELAGAGEVGMLLLAGSGGSPPPIDARAYGGGASTRLLDLGPQSQPGREDLAALQRAPAIAFGPGSLPDWLAALRPSGKTGAALASVREAWSQGALVLGRGDGAALLSGAFVVDGPAELHWSDRNPRARDRPLCATGLGFQPWFLLDTAERSSGRIERLLEALLGGDLDLALYLGARSAVVADTGRGRLIVRGTEPVILIDVSRARRDRRGFRGARWSFLGAGASWDVRRRTLESARAQGPPADGITELRREGALDAQALVEWVLAPSAHSVRRWHLEAQGSTLSLATDEDSSERPADARGSPSLARLRGDWIRE